MTAYRQLAACLLVLILALAACGGGDTPEETAADTPAAKAPATPKDKAPTPVITAAGDLPEGFDLPTHPAAEPAGSMAVPGGGSLTAFSAKAAKSDVFQFYLDELPGKGWSVDSQTTDEEIRASKDGREITIRMVTVGSDTQIAIVEGS